MSESSQQTGPDEIRADIERTRAELADTVDALTDKMDVKARLRPHRTQILIGAGAAVTVLVGFRVWRHFR